MIKVAFSSFLKVATIFFALTSGDALAISVAVDLIRSYRRSPRHVEPREESPGIISYDPSLLTLCLPESLKSPQSPYQIFTKTVTGFPQNADYCDSYHSCRNPNQYSYLVESIERMECSLIYFRINSFYNFDRPGLVAALGHAKRINRLMERILDPYLIGALSKIKTVCPMFSLNYFQNLFKSANLKLQVLDRAFEIRKYIYTDEDGFFYFLNSKGITLDLSNRDHFARLFHPDNLETTEKAFNKVLYRPVDFSNKEVLQVVTFLKAFEVGEVKALYDRRVRVSKDNVLGRTFLSEIHFDFEEILDYVFEIERIDNILADELNVIFKNCLNLFEIFDKDTQSLFGPLNSLRFIEKKVDKCHELGLITCEDKEVLLNILTRSWSL